MAALPVDGVGLLRAEFMITEALHGEHPRRLMADGRERELVNSMADSLLRVTRAFAPRPVVYRAIDFRTNEFRGLTGGADFEPPEGNPMIGYRGCYRYVREPDLFRLELEILARVREETPNLHLIILFVRTLWELERCLELVDTSPLGRQRGLHRWVMAEVPSVVYRIPDYAALGIDGVSIGSNDLTQLMLGVDRDSEICAELFDEADAAVLDAIERTVTASRAAGLTSHALMIGMALEHTEYLERAIDRLDTQIDTLSATGVSKTGVPFAEARRRPTTIPGVGERAAEAIIAEIGVDMSRFPTAGHPASWAGVAPGTNITGGKRRSGKTRPGDRWPGQLLNQYAWRAGRRRDTYQTAQFWRLSRRIGKKKAAVAVSHPILVICWYLLTENCDYQDLGDDYFARRANPDRRRDHHIEQLQALGYSVTLRKLA